MRVPKKTVAEASTGAPKRSASIEIEVKLPVRDRKAMLRLLKKLKATGGDRMHEMNTLYDTSGGTLTSGGRLVRIRLLHSAPGRAASPMVPVGAVLTYKGPVRDGVAASGILDARYKIREEHELRVFQGMGLEPRFRYEKYRTTFRLPRVSGVLVELDETPVGDFLEIEGQAAAIDRAAAVLGYTPSDYITKSYGELFVEHLRRFQGKDIASFDLSTALRTADMLFPHRE